MKPEFLTPLCAKKLPNPPRKWWKFWSERDIWELTEPLKYVSPYYGRLIEVPTGFRTDFASVPRLPFCYLVAGNTAHEAATLHDFLYQVHIVSREMADHILLEAMGPTNVAPWRRQIIFAGVRVGGLSSYNSGPKRFRKFANRVNLGR